MEGKPEHPDSLRLAIASHDLPPDKPDVAASLESISGPDEKKGPNRRQTRPGTDDSEHAVNKKLLSSGSQEPSSSPLSESTDPENPPPRVLLDLPFEMLVLIIDRLPVGRCDN